jgi:hypothetical protein
VKDFISMSVVSPESLTELLASTQEELPLLEKQITHLEKQLEDQLAQLATLQASKNRLLQLKQSLQALLGMPVSALPESLLASSNAQALSPSTPKLPDFATATFIPEKAFDEAKTILKRPDSVNYELFKAVVLHGGRANTEQIRLFLAEHGVLIPSTRLPMGNLPLSEISSRINYLVRKGVVWPAGGGVFVSAFGWV